MSVLKLAEILRRGRSEERGSMAIDNSGSVYLAGSGVFVGKLNATGSDTVFTFIFDRSGGTDASNQPTEVLELFTPPR